MQSTPYTPGDIDRYIAGFSPDTQKLLVQVREAIKKAAPDAEEKMGYGIPTFTLNGNLVHFAGYKNHIGFYPGPEGIAEFKNELSVYESSKGAVQFPIDKPMPLGLITKIVKYRVKQNIERAKAKAWRMCSKGHQYYKTSDCPTCPICEKERKPKAGFLSELVAPARRSLENQGIKTLKQLSRYSEEEILSFHGIGKSSLPKLRSALKTAGLSFRI
jgi:uncharacterized protein YdhG (YjbR/CyaY superfamily)